MYGILKNVRVVPVIPMCIDVFLAYVLFVGSYLLI